MTKAEFRKSMATYRTLMRVSKSAARSAFMIRHSEAIEYSEARRRFLRQLRCYKQSRKRLAELAIRYLEKYVDSRS